MSSMKIEHIAISELKAAEYNPRTISHDMLAKLKKGLERYGFVEPLVINADNTVIGGHQRLKAAQELGLETVPCHRVNLPKQDEKALNLALNKLSGDWDLTKLSVILAEFEGDADFDIEFTGFDNVTLAEMPDMHMPDFESPGEGPARQGDMPQDAPSSGDDGKGYVIQYTIIFDDELQQQEWHAYLRRLKEKYPGKETIAERLCEDIKGK